MRLGELSSGVNARKKRWRVGRGVGSGSGKTSGRGTKGQRARSKPRLGFEGGQMPLLRRIPKRGFRSRKKVEITPVNIEALNRFDEGTEITRDLLYKSGLIKKNESFKLLGKGELKVPLTVKVPLMSKSAKEKIVAAGGRVL